MKRLVIVVVLVCVCVGGLVFVMYTAKSRQALARDIEKDIEVEVIVPAVNPGAPLLLLEHAEFVELAARARLPDQIAQDIQTRSEEFRWSSSAGKWSPSATGRKAIWWPPVISTLTVIRLHYKGWFKRFPDTFLWGPIVVEKSCEIKVVPPTSSQMLHNGIIDGFKIGEYLDPRSSATLKRFGDEAAWPRLHPDAYSVPQGFYKVTMANKDMPISKHFTLGIFAMDYPWFSYGFPQYIALDYGLVEKLEELIAMMEADGFPASDFALIYGFRSPAFNLGTIEQDSEYTLKVPFSLHQYGKAADLIIDHDDDLIMDDLNGDGRRDIYDAAVIMHYVNILDRKYREQGSRLVGGAGLYERHDFRGRVESPYIHIDIRGFTNERGELIRWPSLWPDGTPIRFGQL
jgi:hypothetical protein